MNNPRFPHWITITRGIGDEQNPDPFGDEPERETIYEGPGRSYTRSNLGSKGEVLTNEQVVALPVRQQDWTEKEVEEGEEPRPIPIVGDRVEVKRGAQTEYGDLTDVRPNNFGTDLIFDYVRN
jgi:hypothetical protein